MTVYTMCHHPNLPLDGISPDLLQTFTSRECRMVPQAANDSMMVCGCQGEHECNDKLVFDKGANGEEKEERGNVGKNKCMKR